MRSVYLPICCSYKCTEESFYYLGPSSGVKITFRQLEENKENVTNSIDINGTSTKSRVNSRARWLVSASNEILNVFLSSLC